MQITQRFCMVFSLLDLETIVSAKDRLDRLRKIEILAVRLQVALREERETAENQVAEIESSIAEGERRCQAAETPETWDDSQPDVLVCGDKAWRQPKSRDLGKMVRLGSDPTTNPDLLETRRLKGIRYNSAERRKYFITQGYDSSQEVGWSVAWVEVKNPIEISEKVVKVCVVPEESLHSVSVEYAKAVQSDSDFAWTIFCNLAITAKDAGADAQEADERVADLMNRWFNVDVRKFPQWKSLVDIRNDTSESEVTPATQCDPFVCDLAQPTGVTCNPMECDIASGNRNPVIKEDLKTEPEDEWRVPHPGDVGSIIQVRNTEDESHVDSTWTDRKLVAVIPTHLDNPNRGAFVCANRAGSFCHAWKFARIKAN